LDALNEPPPIPTNSIASQSQTEGNPNFPSLNLPPSDQTAQRTNASTNGNRKTRTRS
jgi:hypothetical protein